MIDLLRALEPDFQKIIGARVRLAADHEPSHVNIRIPAGTEGVVYGATFRGERHGGVTLDVEWGPAEMFYLNGASARLTVGAEVPLSAIERMP